MGCRTSRALGDPQSGHRAAQPADFYSPDTFNYNVLDVSADGKTLTVTSCGVNSTVQNGFSNTISQQPGTRIVQLQIKRHP
mgnify:CR=1 FL=1